MDSKIAALVIEQGSKLLATLIQNRRTTVVGQPNIIEQLEKHVREMPSRILTEAPPPTKVIETDAPQPIPAVTHDENPREGEATAVPTGCLPCALGHYGACTGILNEARRFAQSDGMASVDVIDRVNICMDELNAMERKDLRPQMIDQLPTWEKDLANKALNESRQIRHALESGVNSLDELDHIAARTQETRMSLGRVWMSKKLQSMPPEIKEKMTKAIVTKLENIDETDKAG